MGHDLDVINPFVEIEDPLLHITLHACRYETVSGGALHRVNSKSPGIVSKPVNLCLDRVLSLNIFTDMEVNKTQGQVGVRGAVYIIPQIIRSVYGVITDNFKFL